MSPAKPAPFDTHSTAFRATLRQAQDVAQDAELRWPEQLQWDYYPVSRKACALLLYNYDTIFFKFRLVIQFRGLLHERASHRACDVVKEFTKLVPALVESEQ
jgi:hypothetical protein